MKVSTKSYEAPKAEIIEIETQGVLCMSVGDAPGAGTKTMNGGSTYGW